MVNGTAEESDDAYHVTDVRAITMAYDIAGSGPLVVFLHSIGGNRSNWQAQVAYVTARFCAVAWDARG